MYHQWNNMFDAPSTLSAILDAVWFSISAFRPTRSLLLITLRRSLGCERLSYNVVVLGRGPRQLETPGTGTEDSKVYFARVVID